MKMPHVPHIPLMKFHSDAIWRTEVVHSGIPFELAVALKGDQMTTSVAS